MKPHRPLDELRRYVGGDRDWRQGLWNRWLVSYLTPKDGEEEATQSTEAASSENDASVSSPASNSASTSEDDARDANRATAGAPEDSRGAASNEDTPSERRPLAARARLDALSDQIFALESALDSLSQRLHLGRIEERRQNQRLVDLLERLVDGEERNAEALVGCSRALERLERRVQRLDRWTRPGNTESLLPPDFSEPQTTQNLRADFERIAIDTTPPSREREVLDRSGLVEVDATATMNGNLSDLSLATLLSMFELEQRTGRLTVEGQEGNVGFDLSGGLVVGVRENGIEREAVDALRRALDWRDARFSFSPIRVVPGDGAAVTVGALLLRASHQSDEALRTTG